MSWSSGKDSAWAFYKLQRNPEIDIDGLSPEQISYSTMGRVPQPQDIEDFNRNLQERFLGS